ncbi:MAG: molybdopterin-dependent oxidoreductase [Coriobacteriia bacterium]|nr:molybdopterin-dependent oxidoreductase [Coriobacteriia bacterium]
MSKTLSQTRSEISRRKFLKWSAVVGGTAALSGGLVGCGLQETGGGQAAPGESVWKTAACMNNCSCGWSRCLLKAEVVDGVPVRLITDSATEDTIENPQRRACARGRAQISNILSADRIKYPMKRKNWEPGGGDKSLRGIDEWERISWDEALDIVASEMEKAMAENGTRGILSAAYSDIGSTYFDQFVCLLNELGGSFHHDWGTVSFGSWFLPELLMTGEFFSGPCYMALFESDLHFMFGNNWMANKGGNNAYQLLQAKKASGAKVIIIDPWLNQTAEGIADEWVPIRPGTDTPFVLGMAYHMIKNDLHNQEFLDKYCVGFDADHMPEGMPEEGNFKDYVLGTYDDTPKTPEWAALICGVPADKIKSLTEEVAAAKKVNFFAGQSTTKIPAGEMFAQAFYTLALMHGDIGSPGNYMSYAGIISNNVAAGNMTNAKGLNPTNPLKPPSLITSPDPTKWADDWEAWDQLEYSETWQTVLDGEYGRDMWPGGKKPVDIKMIYTGGYQNSLNSVPNANAAIELWRTVDFVLGINPFFCASVRYADLVLPVQTWWEKYEVLWSAGADVVYWADKVIEPLFEASTEWDIAMAVAERLGVDPAKVETMTQTERTYASLQGATYRDNTGTPVPLITITQEDIDAFGISNVEVSDDDSERGAFEGGGVVSGAQGALSVEPQTGLFTIEEFKERGFYAAERARGDVLTTIPYSAFYNDPEGSPLATSTGKFEIFCASLAYIVNSYGFSTIAPIGMWQSDPEQGQGAQTEEYPLLLWTPHSLRRAHTVNDSVTSLREAFPQECFMSTVDAEARGIKNGDIVLMSSPHGQVLRPAKVMPTVIPGSVALQDGAWTNIDEATGIDIGGNPNIIQAPKASGQGSQSWTGTICQVEKYNGNIVLEPDKHRALILPKGIE